MRTAMHGHHRRPIRADSKRVKSCNATEAQLYYKPLITLQTRFLAAPMAPSGGEIVDFNSDVHSGCLWDSITVLWQLISYHLRGAWCR